MSVTIELPEITGDPAEFLKNGGLSLLEEYEKSVLERVEEEHKKKKEHGRRHSNREHSHEPGEQCERGPKNGQSCERAHKPKQAPIILSKPKHDCDDQLGVKKGRWKAPPLYVKDPNAPIDKGNFVLIIMTLFGLVHILPFIFFFTANEYWMYKFRNTSSNSTNANDRTYLQTNFASLGTLTNTAPSVICNFVAVLCGHKIKAETRVFSVLLFHSLIFVVLAVFTNIDTDSWQVSFFILTMVLHILMTCSMSLGGSGSMGLISKLPPHYMKAQLMGQGVAGVFSSILRLVSIMTTPSTVGAALLYFVTGAILMSITSILFYMATKTEYFKYYTRHSIAERKEKMRNVGDLKPVIKILWPLLLLSAIIMVIPVSSVNNLVVSEYYGTDSIWGTKYFITVCMYIIPSLADLIGRGIFTYMDFECSIPVLYLIVLTHKILFAVLIFLSNARPRHHLPVLLNHDWEYGLMMAANSLTSGFIMNLTMIKTMRMSPPGRIELTMMCNMFFMGILSSVTSPLGLVATRLI